LNLVLHKICPAIAAGCPFILKPSDRTPITSAIVGEILSTIPQLPVGSVSVLPCELADAPIFSEDPRIKCLSFTGSPLVGWKLKTTAGRKRVLLELGGNAACIVDEDQQSDADLDKIADRLATGAFFYAGQSCISVQRVLVHDSVYDRLIPRLVARTQDFNRNMGDPMERTTKLGPMITEFDAQRMHDWVSQTLSGASSSSSSSSSSSARPRVLAGGNKNGNFYEATVVENVPHDSPLWCKEIFGPVCVVEKFSDFKKAIELVNDSEFGLQAGIFTRNLNRVFYAYENLEVGGVMINEIPSARVDAQPYGGIKSSGIGREGLKYAAEEFCEPRSLILKDIGLDA